jgi:hypothetical protein
MRRIDARVVLAVVGVAAAIAVGVVLGGWSSSSSSTAATTTTAELETWAGSVCTAVSSYATSLREIAGALGNDGLSKGSLRGAAEDLKASTSAFVDDIERLGRPEAVANSEAATIVQGLATDLRKDADTIRSATEDVGSTDLLSAAPAVGAALVTAKDHVTSAIEQLKQVDPRGELRQAFANADSCSTLGAS